MKRNRLKLNVEVLNKALSADAKSSAAEARRYTN